MADVKWIKIVTDIFDDEKILLIESMPDRDSIIVIWFKLLCLAGKTNNGGVLLLNDRIPYTDEMLATIFRRPVNTVRFSLQTFEQFGMIEIINDTITIPNWGKHQSLDSIEKKRDYMREYMQEYRQKQNEIACKTNSKTNSKANVSRLDKEEDKEEDKDIRYIVEYLNQKAGTNYKSSTANTKRHIRARLSDGFTVDDFKTVIDKKCGQWIGDSKMQKFLRPETLFGSKFEGYLNEQVTGSGYQQQQQYTIGEDGKKYDSWGNELL